MFFDCPGLDTIKISHYTLDRCYECSMCLCLESEKRSRSQSTSRIPRLTLLSSLFVLVSLHASSRLAKRIGAIDQQTVPGDLDWSSRNFPTWPLFKALHADNILSIAELALAPLGRILFISRQTVMLVRSMVILSNFSRISTELVVLIAEYRYFHPTAHSRATRLERYRPLDVSRSRPTNPP